MSMSVDLKLSTKTKRAAGQRCCAPFVYPDVDREQAIRVAEVAKALGGSGGVGMPLADHHTIRPATAADLPAVLEIYNAGIAERVATFETDPRSESDLAGWTTDSQPFIVATQAGRVVGFARAGSYSNRYVYQGIGEHAVYVHPTARSQGLGRRLLSALCDESERRGLYKLTSRIFTDNHPSRAAHHAAGFKEVGIQRRHGRLEGQWKDCVLVERLLGQAAIT